MFRTLRTAMRDNPLSTAQIEVLTKANQMASAGNPAGAAPLFAEIAHVLETSRPRRAANLHARAAHAYTDANRPQPALEQARAALNMFIQYQMIARMPVFYTNITRKFTNKGMTGAATAMQNEFGGKIGSLPMQPQGHVRPFAKRDILPTNCPKCGGPIHNDSVSWVDNQTVECEYCGSLIRSAPNGQ